MKKRILAISIASIFMLGGCVGAGSMMSMPQMSQQNQIFANKQKQSLKGNGAMVLPKPTLEMYVDNPILNVEIDLILAEELATMLKMNNLVLDRMPISISDKWPELLKEYQDSTLKEKDSKANAEYEKYLDEMLKKDYSFYKIYNPAGLTDEIKKTGGLMLISSPSAMKKIILLKIVERYGKNMEHLKNSISYKPLGCGAKYGNPKFSDMFKPLNANICKKIDRKLSKKCSFFSQPIEDILYKYEDGFYNLKVGAKCFKPVEGKSFSSFKDAFYHLLPNSKRDAIKDTDEKLESVDMDIALLKGKIKVEENSKKKDESKITLMNKKMKVLKSKKDNLTEKRDKLFEEAKSRIVVDKQKALLALKLKVISEYINKNLTGVGVGATVLTINTILDVKDVIGLGIRANQALATTAAIYMNDRRAKNSKEAFEMAKKRLGTLLKRAVKLPQNAVSIVYGISSQSSMLSDYRDYIDAVIEAGKRAKYIKE